jgi:hypothetical protein
VVNFLVIAKSAFQKPGARKIPTPELPNRPGGADTKAERFGTNNAWILQKPPPPKIAGEQEKESMEIPLMSPVVREWEAMIAMKM